MTSITPAATIAGRFGLAPLDHVGFSVVDLGKSLPVHESLFGEFAVSEVTFPPARVAYRGEQIRGSLTVAHSLSGAFEVELIQVNEGSALQHLYVGRHGEGLHHVRFPVRHHDDSRAKLEDAGFTTILLGETANGSTFSYLEAPGQLFGNGLIELTEFAPGDPRLKRLER